MKVLIFPQTQSALRQLNKSTGALYPLLLHNFRASVPPFFVLTIDTVVHIIVIIIVH